jgi:transcriptional regulator with XRE-family HTH domain
LYRKTERAGVDKETREKYEEPKSRYSDPRVQRRLRKIKERHWRENTLLPSQVFGRRLRETRDARNLTLDGLAARMTQYGHPMSKRRLSEIETCKCHLRLDEAFALVEILQAVPLYLLTPPGEMFVRLSEGYGTNGPGLRDWFVSGLPERTSPGWRLDPPPELSDVLEEESAESEDIERVARLARAMVDSLSHGRTEQVHAIKALAEEIERQGERKA